VQDFRGDASLIELMPVVSSWACKQRLIDRVYFFGSRVRGKHKPDSDLDIAVQMIYSDPDTALAHWFFESDAWVSHLSGILPIKVDLQLFTHSITPTISAGIQESSLLVYQRQA
jgi:predicted nucleotidyltransferase